MNIFLFLVWSVVLLHEVSGYKMVCVYTNWSQYRPDGGKFLPEDVDPALCTHLIYVYAKLQNRKLAAVEWNDDGNAWRDGMYKRVNALKQYNPELKTLLGVGGWMMGSKDFSRMASTQRSRRTFAQSAITFLRDREFDGLTIDWQHPTKRGGRPKDRVNFSLLLQELRRAFEEEATQTRQPALLLTAGVSASKYIIDEAYEVKNISKYTDFINVFAYDLHGPWDNFTGHPSPLYARDDELGPAAEVNVDASMKYWISHGIDRSKLVLGISTYGRTFTLKEPRYNSYTVPSTGPGIAGEFTREPGMIAYYERCSQYFDAPRIWDKQSRVAYWYSGDQWIAGEDIESVKHKVNWVRHHGIGGVMLSSLDMDDFSGLFCNGDFYPLLETINTQFTVPLPPMNEAFKTEKDRTRDLIIPTQPNPLNDTLDYNQTVIEQYPNNFSNSYDVSDTLVGPTQGIDTAVATAKLNINTNALSPSPSIVVETPSVSRSKTAEGAMQLGSPLKETSTISSVFSNMVGGPMVTNRVRNERLINDLLNIIKAKSMFPSSQSGHAFMSMGPNMMPQAVGQRISRNRPVIRYTPRFETTTQSQPFTVKPWSFFRSKPRTAKLTMPTAKLRV